jgi:hypothetical protein
MIERHEDVARPAAPNGAAAPPAEAAPQNAGFSTAEAPAAPVNGADGRHARAGRQGARRVHELIREGRLHEQEHGLKPGRQRLRQLLELGKRYDEEHGLRPARPRRSERLSRAGHKEVMPTLLACLVHLAKPSFRAELRRLAEQLA